MTASLARDLDSRGLRLGAPVFVRIFKETSALELWVLGDDRYRLFRRYDICRWSGDLGPKLAEGDGQSPEGFYSVTPGLMNPNSRYHLSFNLGYPNAYDRYHGRTGSYLMVHGDCVSIGCFAMAKRFLPVGRDRNAPIEELWTVMDAAFRDGQPAVPVHIFPFRMTEENMTRHASSRWEDFWGNLKEGFDYFERRGMPPEVTVRQGRYHMSVGIADGN